jgi:hypothetical protein
MAGKGTKSAAAKQNLADGRKDFYTGVFSAFDLSGGSVKLPDYASGFERDAISLRGDWERIGSDIRRAMEQVANV